MTKKVLLLPGDGIGPEVVAEAVKVLEYLTANHGLDIDLEYADIGGVAYENHGKPYPEITHAKAAAVDAILLGAVGGPQWETLDYDLRPERGLLSIRAELDLYANLRPAVTFAELAGASSLKHELVSGLDIMIVRELTGGIYFGEPRGHQTLESGERQSFNTMVYSESEIERIMHNAFQIAQKRNKRVCSVDKANVLQVSELWREIAIRVSAEYPDVELSHMYVDNAVMQLIREPKQFDVIVTGNLFGDILSDAAAMLTGSIGMLPSASLDANGKGMYEPVHGSAPDIAGQNIANPIATVLSAAMMLRYTLGFPDQADKIEKAVKSVIKKGVGTKDLQSIAVTHVGTSEMGDAIVAELG
ncbi:MAG: 3-isopropylmalate dehydrogenase [Arenicella sp.]